MHNHTSAPAAPQPSEYGPLFDLPAQCSQAAKDSVGLVLSEIRQAVLDHIMSCGARGCTDEEGQEATGILGNTWRPRRLDLERMLLIGHSHVTRVTKSGRKATVWLDPRYATIFRSGVS